MISYPKSTPFQDGKSSAKQSSSDGGDQYLSEITKRLVIFVSVVFGIQASVCCFLGVILLVSWDPSSSTVPPLSPLESHSS